jgi:UDP-glucose 4-epimerase
MSTILVTGGAGYIGSHTVVALHEAGYESVIIDNLSNSSRGALDGIEQIINKKVKFYEGDCNDSEFMENLFRAEPNLTGCIHFAADKAVGESVQNPIKYYENNVGSLLILLKMMKKYGVRNLVFSSSCTVYGQPEVLPVSESAPMMPAESPYGNTKQICEEILRDLHVAKESVRSMALRYFNPIGAHETGLIGELPIGTPNNLIPFITQTVAGIRDELTVFGDDYDTPDGSCIRDYIHVVDLAAAHVKALEVLQELKQESYFDYVNLGTGAGNSVLEVIKTFEDVTGEKVNYKVGPRRAGDIVQVWADPKKAMDQLGWKTEKDLATSLADSWNWQKKLK